MKLLGPVNCDCSSGRTSCAVTSECLSFIGHKYVEAVDCVTRQSCGYFLSEKCGCRFN